MFFKQSPTILSSLTLCVIFVLAASAADEDSPGVIIIVLVDIIWNLSVDSILNDRFGKVKLLGQSIES